MAEPLDGWFQREILPHEPALLRYLYRVWKNPEDIHDLRQEIYVRIYESAKTGRPTSAKAFLFATAKNLVTDRIRRGRIVSIEAIGDPDTLNVLTDELTPERRISAWEELRRVARALNRLPPKCREIVWLRKVDQMSHKQIAAHLKISPRTVDAQILKGMSLLGGSVFGPKRDEPSTDLRPSEHKNPSANDLGDIDHGQANDDEPKP